MLQILISSNDDSFAICHDSVHSRDFGLLRILRGQLNDHRFNLRVNVVNSAARDGIPITEGQGR